MPFDWDEINKKWAYEIPIRHAPSEIVRAFNTVEKRFGYEFFSEYKWIRGSYIITLVVDLNKILEETAKASCS